jgi:DNA-binding NtrC family response regulator
LKGEGFDIQAAGRPAEVIHHLEHSPCDCVLMDLNYARDTTSGQEGLDLLGRVRSFDDTLPVVVMTAWGSIDLAVECMRRGARDFVQKPWDNARLLNILRTQAELGRALRRGRRLEAENQVLRTGGDFPKIIADSPDMRRVVEMVERSLAT